MSATDSQGVVLLVSGPAGVGKTTVCEALLKEFAPQLQRAVTATTRPPREGERDGVDYHFLSDEDFDRKVAAGDFYERALVHGRRYGTLKDEVRRRLESGADLLLNVDVQGAEAFRRASETDALLAGRLLTVFLAPEGLNELRARLARRGTDSEEEIERRMQVAEDEMARSGEYDYRVVSSTKENDYARARGLYLEGRARRQAGAPPYRTL